MDFSLAALLVAVLERVHHAFMHRQPDLVLIVVIEPGGRRDAHTHFLGESDALDQCLQNHFHPLRF